ncbi:uncharacterized protein LOC110751602 [Prunus avium]|uniref:Uncharacterized protein LOC110751602 n=1 Tax=Prunus avium TaxID=42229 RepID=A0A6P5RZ78_PRUAV|nr:uncharacterized protein LOC110751602 [Prunus avium]
MVELDQVGSTQIEQNQMELDRYPATKRIPEEYSEIESKPSDDRIGSTQIEQNQRVQDRLRRILEDFRRIQYTPSDYFKCFKLEHNPYEWQFGIRGASGTDFEGGIYHGRIQFPEEYPSKPPEFSFFTENGRFKTHKKIRIRGLDGWQPSWSARDALEVLIDGMDTYPDGELGSVEYNKEERRDLAIKSRAAAPKYGTSERQKLIDEIHKCLLSKSPHVPVTQLPQLSPSQASNGTGGGIVVTGNTFHATNCKSVGILRSMNGFSDEGHKPNKMVEVDIPQSFFEEQGRQLYGARLLEIQANIKLNEQQLASLSSKEAVDEYLLNQKENITHMIKQSLAVGDIYKRENLQLSTEELVKEVENSIAEFKRQKQDYDEERVRGQVQEILERAKVLEWLREHAEIQYVTR